MKSSLLKNAYTKKVKLAMGKQKAPNASCAPVKQ
jgi:hypothetical protein